MRSVAKSVARANSGLCWTRIRKRGHPGGWPLDQHAHDCNRAPMARTPAFSSTIVALSCGNDGNVGPMPQAEVGGTAECAIAVCNAQTLEKSSVRVLCETRFQEHYLHRNDRCPDAIPGERSCCGNLTIAAGAPKPCPKHRLRWDPAETDKGPDKASAVLQ